MMGAIGNGRSVLEAVVRSLRGLIVPSSPGTAPFGQTRQGVARQRAIPAQPIVFSPEAEAALAALDLPPDGPIDPRATLRPRLSPDAAARNFVSWARALDLVGHYSRRSIYALYCEFSEVDDRPPLPYARFLEALLETDGIRRERVRIDSANRRMRSGWRWTIEPATKAAAAETPAPDAIEVPQPRAPAPAPQVEAAAPQAPVVKLPEPQAPVIKLPEPAPAAQLVIRPFRSGIVLPRYVPDQEHPFSLASLRDQEKSARRARLNAAISRKQRGALRRAA